MINDINDLINRVDLFHDSTQLSQMLRTIADDNREDLHPYDLYYLKESAEHIEGQFNLLMDFKRMVELSFKDKGE